MKKLHWSILLLFFFKISYYQAQFGVAKVENNKLKYLNYNVKQVIQNASTDSMLVFQVDKKGERDKSSEYYKKSISSSFFLQNIKANIDFPKVSINEDYSSFKVDAKKTAYIPFYQDGLYVCNQKREIYTHDGSRWFTFTDVEDLIFDAQIKYPNAISYKRYSSKYRKLWVSNFYNSRALVAIYGDNYSSKSDWYFLGHLDKNKKFTPFDKPKKFKLNPVGITPEGYVLFLEYEKADIYDADLNSVSNGTFIPHLQASKKIRDKTKGKIALEEQVYHPKPNSIVQQVKNEGYVVVTKYNKSAAKKGKHLINYANLKGELLFKKWIVSNEKCKPEFRNGVVSVEDDGKWVEYNT